MNGMKKSCDTCMFSCYQKDTSKHPNIGLLRQHCTSEKYNSPEYTEEMYLEDMKRRHPPAGQEGSFR